MESIISCPRVYELNSHYCSCSWNYHINIIGRHINFFSDCMRLFFSFNCLTPNSRTIRWNAATQWISLVKLDATGQMLRPEILVCVSESKHILSDTKSILKRHFMLERSISIDNNLQGRVRLHNIDRLSHNTAFETIFICQMQYMKSASVLFMWYQCLYYPYSLPQHMTFSDLKPKLK